ncbi:hypothetical protein [Pelagibaculum spongiae]|uniref:Uncharacterized protein n=1 Tax=Pelagibaculum spongiae TaxID=2080658 RepID=A0A2V1H2C3_9GAMM|nr:hypothetical protein [Pelagibaculum spongiae]PVZ70531.1 hypothetical protein DC094_08090 [Pelagibaculum spongiae]
MKLYIYIDQFDQDELEQDIINSLSSWVGSSKGSYQLVNLRPEDHPELDCWKLGITLEIKKKIELKSPLNLLYSLAKKHKLDFVIGIIDNKSGDEEDICYFGHEEGRPDLYEIGSYLGM